MHKSVGLLFKPNNTSLNDIISTENFLSSQIVITSGSDKYLLFHCMCKQPLNDPFSGEQLWRLRAL